MDNKRREALIRGTEQLKQAAPVLTALVVGGLVGAGAMMLFAPRSGKETRANLQRGGSELKDKTVGGVKDAVKQVTSRGQQFGDDLMGRADDLQHDGREALADQLGHIETAARKARKMVQP